VGDRVGFTVGALLGEAEGLGVGAFFVYVGLNVGDAEGALLGEAEGLGVGLPTEYVGDCVGLIVGALVGEAVGEGVGELFLCFVVTVVPVGVVTVSSTQLSS